MGVTDSKFIAENGEDNRNVQFCCCQRRKNHPRLLNTCHFNGSRLDSGMVFGGNNHGIGDKSSFNSSCGIKEGQFGTQTLDHSPTFPSGWTEGQFYRLNWAVQCSRRTIRSKAPLKYVAIQVMIVLDMKFPSLIYF